MAQNKPLETPVFDVKIGLEQFLRPKNSYMRKPAKIYKTSGQAQKICSRLISV